MALTRRALLAAVAASVSLAAVTVAAQEKFITVASTTSTEQSGSSAHPPRVREKTGVQVRVVALGTGQALDVGRRGDADVVFVHDKPAEEKFVAEGSGVERKEVMYNDFVLIGPKADPAKIAGGKDIVAALKQVKAAQAPFVSRGDKSGTHAAELRYWKDAGIDIAADKGALVQGDRFGDGTCAQHGVIDERLCPRRPRHVAFVQEPRRPRDPRAGRSAALHQYGVILVNPAKYPHVKKAEGQAFHRLARLAPRGSSRSRATRSRASSSSSRTQSVERPPSAR